MKYILKQDLKKGVEVSEEFAKSNPGLVEEVKDKKFKPEYYDRYYYWSPEYRVTEARWDSDAHDEQNYVLGNCFPYTEEGRKQCELRHEVEVIESELRELADWKEGRGALIHLSRLTNKVGILNYSFILSAPQYGHDYWFKSKESAEAAIDKIGEERLKKYFLYRF